MLPQLAVARALLLEVLRHLDLARGGEGGHRGVLGEELDQLLGQPPALLILPRQPRLDPRELLPEQRSSILISRTCHDFLLDKGPFTNDVATLNNQR